MLLRKRETQFFFYSGKGGVGKTSMAAAAALGLSRKKKVLVVSVDPAHSLSDSFQASIGSEVTRLKKNLYAVEIDPAKAMDEYKEKLAPKLESLEGLGLGGMFDIAGMTPGIDEIAAFDKFLQYMHQKEYDIVIFDTAPTGHALRFLSLPDVLDSWVGKMIKIRMKFSGMINMFKKILPFGEAEESEGMEQMEAMKQRIKDAKEIMSDPARTQYNIVLIPEAMSILESERSLSALKEYSIPVGTIIINQIIPENPGCRFCAGRRENQLRMIRDAEEKFKGFSMQKVSLLKDEVTGFEMLEKLGTLMHS